MAKRIHFLCEEEVAEYYELDDSQAVCGCEWEDDEQVSDDIDEVTCKKCIKRAEDYEALEEEEGDTEEESIEEEPAPVPMHLKAIFTLAPRSLDKGDTKEVPCTWLYVGVASQAAPVPVRKVLVPEIQMQNQINVYLHPTPYITFQEQTLEKYIKQGKVIAAVVAINTNKEEGTMPKKPIVKVAVATKPQAIITEVVHANMPTPQVEALPGVTPLGMTPAPSALDAILARPIAHIMTQAPVGIPDELLPVVVPKKALALPKERSEAELVQGMAPAFAMSSAMYKAFVQAFRQALSEEGLVIVPAASLQHGGVEQSAPEPEPEIWGSILDVPTTAAPLPAPLWGSELDVVEPVTKARSTLKVFTGGQASSKTVKAPERASKGKTDPAIIKAIQTAWKSGKVTQSFLAATYGMTDKKIWYFCSSRCKQYV